MPFFQSTKSLITRNSLFLVEDLAPALPAMLAYLSQLHPPRSEQNVSLPVKTFPVSQFYTALCLAVTLLIEVTSMFKEKLLAIWEKFIYAHAGLNYWKVRRIIYPTLATVADLLAASASEAYVEHIFR